MDIPALQNWLAQPRPALVKAVAEGVRVHVNAARTRGMDFYGYALHPGEPYDIHSLVAVINTEADIKCPHSDSQYFYYRYCVDEWVHWEHDGFDAVNNLLVEANKQFKSMHSKADDDYRMDEFEIAHTSALLDSIMQGLEVAKAENVFGTNERFFIVWISDSDHKIMAESVKHLNSAAVVKEFEREFG